MLVIGNAYSVLILYKARILDIHFKYICFKLCLINKQINFSFLVSGNCGFDMFKQCRRIWVSDMSNNSSC